MLPIGHSGITEGVGKFDEAVVAKRTRFAAKGTSTSLEQKFTFNP